jgi:GT2 family glycosyltransferase
LAALEVTCIIVCFHRPESLRPTLAALEDPRVEVIVVNMEADPEIAEVAKDCVHIPIDGDPGFATGMNLGASRASSEYVVAMNDDLLIELEDLFALRELVVTGEADVALPAILDVEGKVEPTIKALPTPGALFREWLVLPDHPIERLNGRIRIEKWRQPTQPEEVQAAGTPVMATTKTLLAQHPMPDDYFLYWEEIEWFWHLREEGKRILYVPQLRARHLGGRQEISAFKSKLITRNAVRCVRRTQGRSAAVQAASIMLAYNLRLVGLAAARKALRREKAPGELGARWAGLRETPASWREVR